MTIARNNAHAPTRKKIHDDTRDAIQRACQMWSDDARVLRYACGPHEGVTVEDVAKIRAIMIRAGKITRRSYSMNLSGYPKDARHATAG